MQQTETYKLNLIETSDPFSPAPLNENTQKTEAALEAKADAADHAALDQRVQVLELHKFAAGYYAGTGEKDGDSQIIELGFTPAAVISDLPGSRTIRLLCVAGYPLDVMEIVPGGFKVSIDLDSINSSFSQSLNTKGTVYPYVAFC